MNIALLPGFSGLGMRFSGLGMRLSSLEIRLSGLGMGLVFRGVFERKLQSIHFLPILESR